MNDTVMVVFQRLEGTNAEFGAMLHRPLPKPRIELVSIDHADESVPDWHVHRFVGGRNHSG